MERPAWHLILENRQHIAIAQQQVMEYLHQIESIRIPDRADRCQQVIIWRDRIVPLLGADSNTLTQHEHILVMLYRQGNSADYLALALAAPPSHLLVKDSDQCAAHPDQQHYWRDALLCCVNSTEGEVALVDFARV